MRFTRSQVNLPTRILLLSTAHPNDWIIWTYIIYQNPLVLGNHNSTYQHVKTRHRVKWLVYPKWRNLNCHHFQRHHIHKQLVCPPRKNLMYLPSDSVTGLSMETDLQSPLVCDASSSVTSVSAEVEPLCNQLQRNRLQWLVCLWRQNLNRHQFLRHRLRWLVCLHRQKFTSSFRGIH